LADIFASLYRSAIHTSLLDFPRDALDAELFGIGYPVIPLVGRKVP
jgi:hypothetical protein